MNYSEYFLLSTTIHRDRHDVRPSRKPSAIILIYNNLFSQCRVIFQVRQQLYMMLASASTPGSMLEILLKALHGSF
jgi:hypothetical protein